MYPLLSTRRSPPDHAWWLAPRIGLGAPLRAMPEHACEQNFLLSASHDERTGTSVPHTEQVMVWFSFGLPMT